MNSAVPWKHLKATRKNVKHNETHKVVLDEKRLGKSSVNLNGKKNKSCNPTKSIKIDL